MAEQSQPRYDLFVSYAPADQEWVKGYLLDALEQAGVRMMSEEAFQLGAPRLLEFERAFLGYMADTHPEVGQALLETKELSDEGKATLDKAITTVKKQILG